MKVLDVTREQYMRSNKTRRQFLVERNGYKTEETMLRYARFKTADDVVEGLQPKKVKKEKTASKIVKNNNKLDYIIAFDTTASMNTYITSVRSRVKNMLSEIFQPEIDVRIKIIAFGDYCDIRGQKHDLKGEIPGAYFDSGFTTSTNDLVNFVNKNHKTSGGDGDEFYELVIHKMVHESDWREDAQKNILLIGDAKPHSVGYNYYNYYNNIDWRKECMLAKSNDIKIDTLDISGNSFYIEVSHITGGNHFNFKNAKEVDQIIVGSTYSKTSSDLFEKKMRDVNSSTTLSAETKTAYSVMSKEFIN